MRAYPAEQVEWIKIHSQAEEWENMKAFADAFNSQFGLNKSCSALNTVLNRRHIVLNSKMNNSKMSEEQIEWIKDNLDAGVFRNQQHFTDVFNAIFNKNLTWQAMNNILYHRGWSVKTKHNTNHWTAEMDEWLREKYPDCNYDFVELAGAFNKEFGTDKSSSCITKHLERMGVHTPRKKKSLQRKVVSRSKNINHVGRSGSPNQIYRNKGMFAKGKPSSSTDRQLPIGTIRIAQTGHRKVPVIKVQLCNGDSGGRGHGYRRPWWVPLREKVWTDAFGGIPEGYCVVTVDGDPMNCRLDNLVLLDKRGTAVMASHDWWMENRTLTQNAVTWCNLYFVAKDARVDV